ncbi:P-loop containing nucleoside triphosphate hydrolase protein [Aspergillus cavernicola]|uniref:Cell division control protein n=1 Tax=Aspergillus cavernicola TaxID=176166 RepID=A0ABR4ILX2_9EURO
MVATVLGKRQRSAVETEVVASLPLRSGSRRRTQLPRIHREDNPPLVRQLRSQTKHSDDFQRENGATTKDSLVGSDQPRRKVVQSSQVPSPSKENTLEITSTLVNDENSKPAEIKTPSKARYRNALESPPITPKHRVQVGAKCQTPRTPRTPRQAATSTTVQTIYTRARQLFARGATSGRIVGRDAERQKLVGFIQEGMQSRKGGCMYVSGPPGTGKSALVREVCDEIDLRSIRVAQLNCASIRTARDVYSKLIEELCDDAEVFKKSEIDRLKSMFVPEKKHVKQDMFLVMLDEIDHLLTADAGILQSLFEWSLQKESKVMLIGIANALDLTDRSLPQLKAKNLKPLLLPFLPYTAGQIANVIVNRLKSLLAESQTEDPNFIPFVQPTAIQLCSKKVASQTGDLRKAFELIKRAIDIIEQETLQKLEKNNLDNPSGTILVENNNLSSSPKHSLPKQNPALTYTTLTAPRASIAHVAKITSSVFGQGTVQRLQYLNLQQKAAICALIALDRKRRECDVPGTPSKYKHGAPTVKQIFGTYCTLCRTDNILHPLTATEFKDVLGSLETLGLVGEYQSRGRGGTVAGGSDIRRTPSKPSAMSLNKALDEQSLVCFVSQKEIESQITGPGEGILRRLFLGEGL